MKVLVIGLSGSGKTYLSHALKTGINAFDGDEIEGLSAWNNQQGKKMPPPTSVSQAASNKSVFLWSKKFLMRFLNRFSEVYIFGDSGNVFDLFELFDEIYFFKVSAELQQKRLNSPNRKNQIMDNDKEGLIIWGQWFEEEAKKRKVPFIDASQTPEQVFKIISQKS